MVDAGKPDHPLIPRRRWPFTPRQIAAQILVAAVILISGILIGSGGTILALKDRIVPTLHLLPPDPRPGPGPDPNGLVTRWKDEYSLSDKQAGQTKITLTRQFAATRDLWRKFAAAEQQEREKFAEAMKKILTPEQFTKWQHDLEERFNHWQRMRPFDGRGGGRGGPPRGERRPDRPGDPNGRRGGWPPDRFKDSDGRRMMDGPPPRPPMDPNGRPRGDWRPRPRMDPNDERQDMGGPRRDSSVVSPESARP